MACYCSYTCDYSTIRIISLGNHCKMGGRSAKAIRELEEKFGFTNLFNLKGGILSYIDEVQPELTKY